MPLGVATMIEALDVLPRLAAEADVVELRLDYFAEPYDLARLLGDRRVPVVVTVRPTREGGRCGDSDRSRLAVLRRAADLGAEYVDVEWDAATPDDVAALREAGARVIVSRHNFVEMPADFAGWVARAADLGADIVKVVGFACDVRDALPVFRALGRADRPTIALAMGEAGLPSRVLALRYDSCFLTFATARTEPTAPGQLSVSALRDIYRARCLRPTTAVCGILSPQVATDLARRHHATFTQRGIDAVAVPFPTQGPASAVITAYRELPVAGWHVVDAPLQSEAPAVVDRLTAVARRMGKVNHITGGPDGLVGDWVENSDEGLARWFDRA